MNPTTEQTEMFRNDLMSEEKILWVGRPDTSVIFNAKDIYTFAFGLVWLGLLIYTAAGQAHSNMPLTISSIIDLFSKQNLMFYLFFGLGVFFIVGNVILRNVYKRFFHYAVTNKRILFLNTLFRHTLTTEFINTLPGVDKRVRNSGIGTLTFDCLSTQNVQRGNGYNYSVIPPATFYDIQDANNVYKMIMELRNTP